MLSHTKCYLAFVFAIFFALSANVAIAQEEGSPEETEEAQAAEEPQMATEEVSAQETSKDLQQFAAALNDAAVHLEALAGVEDLTAESVLIVRTSELSQQDEVAMLVEGTDPGSGDLEELRTGIRANAVISSALEEGQHSADDVIAVYVSDEGTVTVYTP